MRAPVHDIVRHHYVPGDDLDAIPLERAVVRADHVSPYGRLGALVHTEPVIDHVVLDQRPRATAPDFDPQTFAPGTAHSVVADHQLGRVVAKDAASPGLVNRVAQHLVPYAAPSQPNAAAVLGPHADVLDPAVGNAAVGDASLHRRIVAGEQDRMRSPGLDVGQVADREVVEPEPSGVAATDSLVQQRAVLAVQRHVGQFHVLAVRQADQNRRLGTPVDERCLLLSRPDQPDL